MSFNFDDVADLILSIGSNVSPSELHGQLCGLVTFGCTPSEHQWIRQVTDMCGVSIEIGSRIADDFIEFGAESQASLANEDLGFELFLPDDDEDLRVRMEELATWCSGFMTGVAMANSLGATMDDIDEHDQELLQDLVAISSLDIDDDDDASEADYHEVVQYIRLGVSQLCLDLVKKNQPESSETLH